VIFGGEIGGEKGILRLKWSKSLPLRIIYVILEGID